MQPVWLQPCIDTFCEVLWKVDCCCVNWYLYEIKKYIYSIEIVFIDPIHEIPLIVPPLLTTINNLLPFDNDRAYWRYYVTLCCDNVINDQKLLLDYFFYIHWLYFHHMLPEKHILAIYLFIYLFFANSDVPPYTVPIYSSCHDVWHQWTGLFSLKMSELTTYSGIN